MIEDTTKLSKDEALLIGERIIEEQDVGRALFYGLGASLACIMLWNFAVLSTGLIMSYYGLIVGVIVGYSIKLGGKGLTFPYQLIAFAYSVIACILGNFASVYFTFDGLVIPYDDRYEVFVEASVY